MSDTLAARPMPSLALYSPPFGSEPPEEDAAPPDLPAPPEDDKADSAVDVPEAPAEDRAASAADVPEPSETDGAAAPVPDSGAGGIDSRTGAASIDGELRRGKGGGVCSYAEATGGAL